MLLTPKKLSMTEKKTDEMSTKTNCHQCVRVYDLFTFVKVFIEHKSVQ